MKIGRFALKDARPRVAAPLVWDGKRARVQHAFTSSAKSIYMVSSFSTMTESASATDSSPPGSLGRRLIHGSTWMVAMRMGIRGIGLVNTLVLARLLTPSDFGIVAMAMLLVSFIEVFAETGQQSALIRHPNPQRAHYDTAWTMSLLINSALCLIILAASKYSVLYFHDERIVPVIQFLAFRVFVGGFLNIGVVNFRRDLDFAREFRFGVFKKVLTLVATITMAFAWRDYSICRKLESYGAIRFGSWWRGWDGSLKAGLTRWPSRASQPPRRWGATRSRRRSGRCP